jgi:hypothetical protein
MNLLMPSSAKKNKVLAAAGRREKTINANNFQEELGSVGRQDA